MSIIIILFHNIILLKNGDQFIEANNSQEISIIKYFSLLLYLHNSFRFNLFYFIILNGMIVSPTFIISISKYTLKKSFTL